MALYVLIVVVSFIGVVFAALPSGMALQKVALLGLSVLLVFAHRGVMFPREALRLILPFVVYLVFAFTSAYMISSSFFYSLAAVQPLVLGLTLYAASVTLPMDEKNLVTLKKLWQLIIATQIAFSVIKLFTHGVDEKVLIGTMSHSAGQLGFLIPAIAVPLLMYMLTPRNRLLIYALVAGMFAFGVINEKRTIVFLLPLIVIASVIANRRVEVADGNKKKGASLGFALVLVAVGVYFGIRTIPSLNVGGTYAGEVSLTHAVEYAMTYVTMDYGGPLQLGYEEAAENVNVQAGRVILLLHLARWVIEADPVTFWFGAGFGNATPSDWLDGSDDPLFDLVGSRGAISGLGLTLVETGMVGVILMTSFFIWIIVATVRNYRLSKSDAVRRWYRTLLIVIAVFWYDFFFYSTVLLRTLPMPTLLFAVIASIPAARVFDRGRLRGAET